MDTTEDDAAWRCLRLPKRCISCNRRHGMIPMYLHNRGGHYFSLRGRALQTYISSASCKKGLSQGTPTPKITWIVKNGPKFSRKSWHLYIFLHWFNAMHRQIKWRNLRRPMQCHCWLEKVSHWVAMFDQYNEYTFDWKKCYTTKATMHEWTYSVHPSSDVTKLNASKLKLSLKNCSSLYHENNLLD